MHVLLMHLRLPPPLAVLADALSNIPEVPGLHGGKRKYLTRMRTASGGCICISMAAPFALFLGVNPVLQTRAEFSMAFRTSALSWDATTGGSAGVCPTVGVSFSWGVHKPIGWNPKYYEGVKWKYKNPNLGLQSFKNQSF